MPDGQIINLNSQMIDIPELLFKPPAEKDLALQDIAYNAIHNCEIDLRREFINNIIVSGGSTMF
jgi:actin-related protein